MARRRLRPVIPKRAECTLLGFQGHMAVGDEVQAFIPLKEEAACAREGLGPNAQRPSLDKCQWIMARNAYKP
jgi:hypothetical protein